MKKLLHIIATPREEESRTIKVSEAFLDTLMKKHPGCKIDGLNLFKEKLPELTAKSVNGKYILLRGNDLPEEFHASWQGLVNCITRFLSQDAYLITAPMWNFSIPYVLKHYIDIIIQPKYLFRYTAQGPEGLVKNKKMVVITSRGGDYSPKSPYHTYDFQENYLRTIFGFVGITDITFINAQPMDALGPQVEKEKITAAQNMARKAAEEF